MDDVGGPTISVGGPEADHALRVLRLRVGDAVVLFDGRGRQVEGRISAASTGCFEVTPAGPVRCVSASAVGGLTVAVATPKAGRADWLVEKCAELGVAELWLLQTTRTSVVPGEGKLQRWRRKAVAAAKQAGAAQVMAVEAPRSLVVMVGMLDRSRAVLYADPSPMATPLIEALPAVCDRGTVLFVGPEGGFTAEEIGCIEQAGGRAVRLGALTLRVETAAIAAAAIWSCSAGADDPPDVQPLPNGER